MLSRRNRLYRNRFAINGRSFFSIHSLSLFLRSARKLRKKSRRDDTPPSHPPAGFRIEMTVSRVCKTTTLEVVHGIFVHKINYDRYYGCTT